MANDKIGHGGISSYNHVDDVIYFNSFYHTQERIDNVVRSDTFAAQDLSGIIRHEFGHKLHWDAVKGFYRAHESKYNSIEEAKHDLDADVERYVAHEMVLSPAYLRDNVSYYSSVSYFFAKKIRSINLVNEIIAEVYTLQKCSDSKLNITIRKELNYAKKY